MMSTPSFQEDHISQIPGIQMLNKLGYDYLSPEEALLLRGGKTTQVLLEDVLRRQLREINTIKASGTRTAEFSDANIEAGIQALKELPMQEGYLAASEVLYNLITLGKALEQSLEGDKKSYTLRYVDWDQPKNNVYHVTEEFKVMRSTSKEHYIPDLVLFVNGIPLCIIECKRPDKKDSISQAISQHLRSQQDDGIRALYVYSQLLLSVATDQAAYGTNKTQEKFWAQWEEKHFGNTEAEKARAEQIYRNNLLSLKNQPLKPEVHEKLFGERYPYVRQYFEAMAQQTILPTLQDEYLYNLCRPERLLDLIFNFVLYDDGIKKVARYQQYFAIKKTIQGLRAIKGGRRSGGVIWHTQGSGKSLTMVMLAQAIALEKSIRNPRIILVTDRTDLDDQITGTFRKCGKYVENATTGQRLTELLESNNDAVITTIINKFKAAIRKIRRPLDSPDIFVLVDEGHRTQHGTFNIDMQKALPNACFIALTGTPLFKKDKSTAAKFGGIIDDYTVDKAVKDKAVVPLLYEGRFAVQQVNEQPIDNYFSMVSEDLSDYQRADLKKKFSRANLLQDADLNIYAICWDISRHYRDNWQGTPFKGQLVCKNKETAIRYKNYMDQVGWVSTELLISPPDDREGEESADAKSDDMVKRFYAKMMNEHTNQTKYEKNIINRFKYHEDPEIIIVVDKLLTGFDEPKNVVLYLTRKLNSHKLLQAIARVNRVHEDKDFGYIIDYAGVLGELGSALEMYSSLSEFDEKDLEGTLTNIGEEIKKLPQKHSVLWDIFKTIPNKRDAEAYAQLLRDEAIRVEFYDKLAAFAKSLKLALSSIEFHNETDERTLNRYKEDLTFFMKLRIAVVERYSDKVDFKKYEGQIQKLIDTHIQTDEIKTITELVNIFDKEKFQAELEGTTGSAAKADKIASRTAKHINEKMEDDPAFYRKFSQMLKDALKEYEEQRLSEAYLTTEGKAKIDQQHLANVKGIMHSVLSRTDSDIPEVLLNKEVAKAFYGLTMEYFEQKVQEEASRKEISAMAALKIDELVQQEVLDNGIPIIDWPNKSNIKGKLIIDIGDYLIDEVRDKYKIKLSFGEMDAMAEKYLEVAIKRYQ